MKYWLSLFLLLTLFSCDSNTIYEEPKDLISKDSMVLLLTDMYTAISARNIKNKFNKKKSTYMPLVYEKYKIDSIRFNSSSNFYTSKIEPYNDVLNRVKEKIELQLDSLQKKVDIQDSIKKAVKKERKDKRRKLDSIREIDKLIRKDSIKKWSKSYFFNLDKYFLETSKITSETGSKE